MSEHIKDSPVIGLPTNWCKSSLVSVCSAGRCNASENSTRNKYFVRWFQKNVISEAPFAKENPSNMIFWYQMPAANLFLFISTIPSLSFFQRCELLSVMDAFLQSVITQICKILLFLCKVIYQMNDPMLKWLLKLLLTNGVTGELLASSY